MPDRDPRTDPREGDELRERAGARLLLVDLVRDGWVYWRTVTDDGGLIAAWRAPLTEWRELAPKECEAPHAAP